MERLTLRVTEAQAGRTVLSLMRRELSMADGLISSAKFRPDGVLLDGRRVRVTERVRAGAVLSVDVSDRGQNKAAPIDLPLSILWEDDFFAVLDKPAGVGVYGEGTPNVAGILAKKWGKDIEFHPVNRLDVGTTGLMLAAKDGYTHDRLRRLLHMAYQRFLLSEHIPDFPESPDMPGLLYPVHPNPINPSGCRHQQRRQRRLRRLLQRHRGRRPGAL